MGAMRIQRNLFDDRCSAESALRPFDQQSDDVVPDRSIVRREKWNSSCDRQFRYRVRVIFDVRSVGVVEDMRAKYLIGHLEFSRILLIIHSKGACASQESHDGPSHSGPIETAARTICRSHSPLPVVEWNPATLIFPNTMVDGNKRI
jgi:hypothetical protein